MGVLVVGSAVVVAAGILSLIAVRGSRRRIERGLLVRELTAPQRRDVWRSVNRGTPVGDLALAPAAVELAHKLEQTRVRLDHPVSRFAWVMTAAFGAVGAIGLLSGHWLDGVVFLALAGFQASGRAMLSDHLRRRRTASLVANGG